MSQNPLISVVMPVYNGQHFLVEAIESILNQSYKNFELIILDDHSTDNSFSVIEKYAKRDPRIVPISNEVNLGIAKNRNKGTRLAKGKYIANMDQDDVSTKNRLLHQLQFMENNPKVGAVGGQVTIIDARSKPIGRRQYPTQHNEIVGEISTHSPMCNPATLLRKKCFTSLGYYDERFPGVEDYDMWFRLLANGWELHNLNETCLNYRTNENQVKSSNLKTQLSHSQAVQRRWIFQNEFRQTKATLLHCIRYLLFLLPNKFILNVFEKTYYIK